MNSISVTSVVEEEGVKYPPPKTPLVGDDPEPNVPNFGSGVMSPKSDAFPVDAIVANSIVLTNPDGDALDFGDLTEGRGHGGACSNGHGGL